MSFEVSKIKPDNARALAIIAVVIVAVLILVKYGSKIFGFVTGIFDTVGQGIGIEPTANATDAKTYLNQQDNNQILGNAPLNPALYNSAPSGATELDNDTANAIATAFWDAGSWINTDGNGIIAAMQRCRTQVQVSQVAQAFSDLYQDSLYSWLRTECVSATNNELLAQAIKYANSLPMYN